MSSYRHRHRPPVTRREALCRIGNGFGMLAFASLVGESLGAAGFTTDQAGTLSGRPLDHPARAKHVIFLFMNGGLSQVDSFDPKPMLAKYHGQPLPGGSIATERKTGALMQSPFAFKKYGQCGMEMAEIIPHIGSIADDITLIRSMHTGVNNHLPSMYALNTGKHVGGRAHLGSWLSYGLGTENQNLPAFENLIDPRGGPLIGGENWTNGWLPSLYQGTVVRPKEPRILNLDAPAFLSGAPQARQLAYLEDLNRRHLEGHPGELDLEARIASYELAGRMQTAAKEALDIRRETAATLALYGIDEPATRKFGTSCLIARRLIERGVRFVQLWNYAWDMHENIAKVLPQLDAACSSLVADLAERGMLQRTIVAVMGDFGRTPRINASNAGRDHWNYCYSLMLFGGGFNEGLIYGSSDKIGAFPASNALEPGDIVSTMYHQLGIRHDGEIHDAFGRPFRLVPKGDVVDELIA